MNVEVRPWHRPAPAAKTPAGRQSGGYDYEATAQRLTEAVREIPGLDVVSSSGSGGRLIGDGPIIREIEIFGNQGDESGEKVRIQYFHADSEYFEAMGIPIKLGRAFQSGDEAPYEPRFGKNGGLRRTSFIVDEAFASRCLKGRNPLDTNMRVADGDPWSPIVGVAGRANYNGLDQRDGLPVIYFFGERRLDLPSYAYATCFLMMVALLASYLPARRAVKVDPLVALRSE